MHAVVVKVSIHDAADAQANLEKQVVPTVSRIPGFAAGYWTRSDDGSNGIAMVVFDSEDAARAASERIPESIPHTVTLENVEVREVVAHA